MLLEMIDMTYAEKLKELMTLKGFTAQSLADESELSKRTIDEYMQGRNNPSVENLFAISRAMNVDVREFEGCSSSPGRRKKKKKK